MRARDDMVGTVTVKGFVSYIFDDSVSSNYLIEMQIFTSAFPESLV